MSKVGYTAPQPVKKNMVKYKLGTVTIKDISDCNRRADNLKYSRQTTHLFFLIYFIKILDEYTRQMFITLINKTKLQGY